MNVLNLYVMVLWLRKLENTSSSRHFLYWNKETYVYVSSACRFGVITSPKKNGAP